MQNWLCAIIITFLFICIIIASTLFGYTIPLLLCATSMILVHQQTTTLLKLYAMTLVCFDYFIWHDQFGPPLVYLVPLYALAPVLNQLLMPCARSLLPYIFFTLAFGIQTLALEPSTTGFLPSFTCTFPPFCATLLVMYIILSHGSIAAMAKYINSNLGNRLK